MKDLEITKNIEIISRVAEMKLEKGYKSDVLDILDTLFEYAKKIREIQLNNPEKFNKMFPDHINGVYAILEAYRSIFRKAKEKDQHLILSKIRENCRKCIKIGLEPELANEFNNLIISVTNVSDSY